MSKPRYRKLTNRQIISLFKFHNPKNLTAINKLGIKTRFLDKGIDRRAYKIGTDLVLKIEDHKSSSYDQTPHEIKIFKLIHTNDTYKRLRPHIPKLLYGNAETRIMIVPFYPGVCEDEEDSSYVHVSQLINELLPECFSDLHGGNFRYAKNGLLMCIDLGYTEGD